MKTPFITGIIFGVVLYFAYSVKQINNTDLDIKIKELTVKNLYLTNKILEYQLAEYEGSCEVPNAR